MNTASLKSSLTAFSQSINTRRDANSETINTQANHVKNVATKVDEVGLQEAAIIASKVLSDQGKREALAEMATASAAKLSFLERVVTGLADDLRTTRERLYTIPTPARFGIEAQVQYGYGREIRQDFKGLSQQERDAKFLTATQSGDDAIVWAILNAPTRMISQVILDRALEERARRLNPETVKRLHQVEMLHESLSGLRDTLVGWLRGLGGDQTKIFDELGGDAPPEPSIDKARRMVSA